MSDYELIVDFVPDSRNPARVFRAMTGLIDSFARFDGDFLESIDVKLGSQFLLHDVQRGSLKAVLRRLLQIPDREALRDGDAKKVIGRLLDDGRDMFLRFLEDKPKVESVQQLEVIQGGLLELAAQAPGELVHVPSKIPLPRILTTIETLETSTRVLIEKDSAHYHSERHQRMVSKRIEIEPQLQDELLKSTPVEHPTRMYLPVKKPDLIGDSQWDLYMAGRVIRAKISDVAWLQKFHSREIELKPGDALDATLEIILLQDYRGEVVGYRYQVHEVHGVTHQPNVSQMEFPGWE